MAHLLHHICTGCLGFHIYDDPNCAQGRDTIVHLFEWKWTDIEQECERFLGPKGYCGVQVSPPNENAVITSPNRPWWERYQPVSYTLITRSGNEQEFRNMVQTCNKHNVRIYVDAIINHMTADHAGIGTAGNTYDGPNYDYPGVPYNKDNFNGHEGCSAPDTNLPVNANASDLRNCRLLGLDDLALGKEYVREMISDYMNKLIDMGVAGFRIDAAKHMWPGDLSNIFTRLHDLAVDVFGPNKRPFVYQEIFHFGDDPVRLDEYYNTGRVTNFPYGINIADTFLRNSLPFKNLVGFGPKQGMPPSEDALVFLSNHDNQRGHGNAGAPITFRDPKNLKLATAFMLAYDYGVPRIMSSFNWTRNFYNGNDQNSWHGPPHFSNMSIKSVKIHKDQTCGDGWVCEHRWPEIYKMVRFRNVVNGTYISKYQTFGDYQIAFSRGNKGFIAFVADNSVLNEEIDTGLPAGTYCDVISGESQNGVCSGMKVVVKPDGRASIVINGNAGLPAIAIHIDIVDKYGTKETALGCLAQGDSLSAPDTPNP